MEWQDTYGHYNSENEALWNSQTIATYLAEKGWSKEAISALLGNMWQESTVNPNLYEKGYSWAANRGYGLVQWTPRSELTDWAKKKGLDYRKGEVQLEKLIDESIHGGQWYKKPGWPDSFQEFIKNTNSRSVAFLTEEFTWNYERPAKATANIQKRINFAEKAYKSLTFGPTESPYPKPYEPKEPNPPSDATDNPDSENRSDDLIQAGKEILQALSLDVHQLSPGIYGNFYIRLVKQYNNTWKIQPNLSLHDLLKGITGSKDIDVFPGTHPSAPSTGDTDRPETPSTSTNDKIKAMTKKAYSYPNRSVKYSMNGPRDMVTSGDCSAFVSHILNAAGLKVGNGSTHDLYVIGKKRGWTVIDGYSRDVPKIIEALQEGDYVIMSKSDSFQTGGVSHVMYAVSHTVIRHQANFSSGPKAHYGPRDSVAADYFNREKSNGYRRWALMRPFK